MKKFAYIGSDNMLFIAEKEETAREHCQMGQVVATEVPARGGHPVVDDEEILVYNETTMKLEAKSSQTLDSALYPQLAELYRQCR